MQNRKILIDVYGKRVLKKITIECKLAFDEDYPEHQKEQKANDILSSLEKIIHEYFEGEYIFKTVEKTSRSFNS